MEVSPDTFDICGDDIYSVKEYDHSSQKQRFEYMTELAHGKMITLSECGYIPDPDEMKKTTLCGCGGSRGGANSSTRGKGTSLF